ncbi:hypothetical protein LOK49_Contig39G00001 [Camellia lanceoleosa]|nr:hypothetical protein LOK49_Contig39G00001 [Camellia lanceoleosa]
MMEHKSSPLSIDQSSLNTFSPKRHKADLSISSKERKEKLSERIVALQQLVSPYGKMHTFRIGIGKSKSRPVYRLCMVQNVDVADRDRQYKLENKTTYKYLNVVWGNESSAARWQMAMVSDSPPLKNKFDQWVREVECSGVY